MSPNRLAQETSPYLLQHRDNPVDWYPWGPDALERARAEDRPIFLSIGYAACHWCHVMEHESFEDEETAADLNRSFVSVKVDREERPDLDAIYMDAVQALTGQGGWPMSVFLTPDGRPFYGGTYFPNERRYGMPAFRDVLAALERAWREQRAEVESSAARLAEAIDRGSRLASAPIEPDEAFAGRLERAVGALRGAFDPVNGSWGGAPKFPQPMTIEFVLRMWTRGGDPEALEMARTTLERMAAGGIHDQVGGGFHRYATDAIWLVPHFEKMLYDNALLATAYLHAWQATGDSHYLAVSRRTLDYLLREMTTDEGAFAASQDADTEGHEGLTYVWTLRELEPILREDAPLFAAAYDVTPVGNWEGSSIPRRVLDDARLAERFGMTEEDVSSRLERARSALLSAREKRPQPPRDDKALAGWNGLAIGAFAQAGAMLEEPRYVAAAERAAGFLLGALRPDGRLRRSYKDGRASHQGVLEDHANLADGLLSLYEATGEGRWFSAARELVDQILAHFRAPDGGFFDTADDHETLITRPRSLQDNAVPSGSAMATLALLRLAALTGESSYRDAAEASLRLVADLAPRYPTAFAQWLSALDLAVGPIDEIAIVGEPLREDVQGLARVTREGFRPRQVLALGPPGAGADVPLLADRSELDGRATAYVCRGFVCDRPVTDPAELRARLAAAAGTTAVSGSFPAVPSS